MLLTTKNIKDIKRLHEEGLNDREISEELGLHYSAVGRHRRQMGFSKIGRNKKQHMYTVWSAETDHLLCCGTAPECAEILGFRDVSIFYQTISKTKAGKTNKYIFLVEPYEDEGKEGNSCEGECQRREN